MEAVTHIHKEPGTGCVKNILPDIIINKMRQQPISFRDFMEMALYYPGYGYYSSDTEKIGREGDYFTSTTLSPLFADMIAMQIEEMWILMGKPAFSIVEYGAGNGALCNNILNYLKKNKSFYNRLNYFIIEKSESMRRLEKTILKEKVQWINSIHDIKPLTGCILSNELIDNFPVHSVVMHDQLMEIFIDHRDADGFVELLRPAGPQLKQYFFDLGIQLAQGYRSEVNLEAINWLHEISESLHRGFVFTIDYGFLTRELNGNGTTGSIHCYKKHEINSDPYHDIGMQDITSYVNFSALVKYGSEYGLNCCGVCTQSSFLHALGFAGYLQKSEREGRLDKLSSKEKTFLINTLMLSMGQRFKVLVQQKGISPVRLSGMKFSTTVT